MMGENYLEHYHYLKKSWMETLKNSSLAVEFIFTVLFLVFTMLTFARYTQFIEMRKGIQFSDPVLQHFTARNFSVPLFFLIYGSICVALASLLHTPRKLMLMLQAYSLMVLFRMISLYILPLAPPEGMIFLKDPLTQFFGTSSSVDNNLFFSGHTATIFLLFLAVPKKLKFSYLIATLFIAAGVLLQKTHYTVDVLIAPCISFISYFLVHNFFKLRYKHEANL